DKRSFRIEAIEPRILLSGDVLLAGETYAALQAESAQPSSAPIVLELQSAITLDAAAFDASFAPVIESESSAIPDAQAVIEDQSALIESGASPAEADAPADSAIAATLIESAQPLKASAPSGDAKASYEDAMIEPEPRAGVFARGPPSDPAAPAFLASEGSNDSPSSTVLTAGELSPIVAEAISRWDSSGLEPFGAVDLNTLSFVIGDLSAGTLADISGSVVTIDESADGYGWFVDATPSDDSEFAGALPIEAADGIDLLTTVMHELGHALGFVHSNQVGLRGVDVMVDSLAEGVRRLPLLADGAKLNDIFNVILATFDPANPPSSAVVFNSATTVRLPNSATVGTTTAGTPDLQLEGLTLTFSELAHTSSWSGEVLVESELSVLLPGVLDIVIVDDNFGAPVRVESATAPLPDAGGWAVTFTVGGDHSDLAGGAEIAVLNSNEPGFDDTSFADAHTIVVSSATYDESSDETTIEVVYNFDPGSAPWTGGSVIAVEKVDVTDDLDLLAVSGTIQLAEGDHTSLLNLESLRAADLGWPKWLDIRITDLKLEFADFRVDETLRDLRLDADFLGFDTGNPVVNLAIGALFKVQGSASGVIFDMDRLSEGRRGDHGAILFRRLPIVDLGGVSGFISGSLPTIGGISAGFILKQVGIDVNGNLTTNTNEIDRTIVYGAFKGSLLVGGKTPEGPKDKNGNPPAKVGGYGFGFNFAISGLGPLQLFVFVNVPILLDPVSGLSITSLRGGVRFNSTLEDLQVRAPFNATGGSATASGDAAKPVMITLTVPGHNLKVGDEFRITAAGDPDLLNSSPDNFVVVSVDGDSITYLTGDGASDPDPAHYAFGGTIEVKKISISDPFDLRDPGFGSSKDVTLQDWEAQLDQQVVNQANAGDSLWEVLFDKLVIEAGATLSFAPRIPAFLVSMDVDLLFDTQLHLLVTGTMNLVTVLKIPVKLYGDFSEVGAGALTLLGLADVPQVPANAAGIMPILVVYAGIKFETLVNGQPSSIDTLTGFPAGVGDDVASVTVDDLSMSGAGPWQVTLTFDNAPDLTTEYAAGDTISIVGSQPDNFNGSYTVTNVTPTAVSFVVGSVIIDGLIDVDRNGVVDASDNGELAGIPIIGGRLDVNRNGGMDDEDDGEIFNIIRDGFGRRQVVSYAVINGEVDVNGDDVIDQDDDIVVGENPATWDSGFDLTRDIIDGWVDIDSDGVVNSDPDDIGALGPFVVIEGQIDMNRDGVIDMNDDGTILNVIIDSAGNRTLTSYEVVDGLIDIDGDHLITAGDDLVLNTGDAGGYWLAPGFKAANQDDLGDGLRISVLGGIELNIPFLTTLALRGTATLDLTFGGAHDARIDFTVDMALSETHVGDIGRANGQFAMTMDGTGGPVVEGIELPQVELWGAAVITGDFSFLNRFGLFPAVSGVLVFNTTSVDQDPITLNIANSTITVVPTAETFALRLDGTIDFRIDFDGNHDFEASERVFQLAGIFVLSFTGEDGFNVALFSEPTPGDVGPAILKIGPGSTPLLQFTAFGFLTIRDIGIAANIVIGLEANVPGPFNGFATVNGQFVFMVNTTGMDITFDIPAGVDNRGGGSDLTVMIPRAPPQSIADASLDVFSLIAGTAWDVPANAPSAIYLLILVGGTDATTNPDASLNLSNALTLNGKFGFLASVDANLDFYLEMQFDAKLELQPLNGVLLVSGSLKIDDAGVVGSLAVGGQLALAPLTIVGAFTLEVNTTDASESVNLYEFDYTTEQFKRNGSGDLVLQSVSIAPNTVALFAFAKFKLAGAFELRGSVSFVNGPALLLLDVNLTMDFFGLNLSVAGGARIVKSGATGMVLKLSASLNSPQFGVGAIFRFAAAMELRVNTRFGPGSDANDLGIARQTYRVELLNASVTILSAITLTGSGFAEVTGGVFRIQASLGGNFLSVVSVSASAFFSSEGEFSLSLDGGLTLGTTGFNIHGTAHLGVSLLDNNGTAPFGNGNKVLSISGSVTVSGTLFYVSLPSVTIGVSYTSSTGAITVNVGPVPVPGIAYKTVNLGILGKVKVPYPIITLKYFRFTIGSLSYSASADPVPPPPVVLGQVNGSGLLTLNVGPDAAARNLSIEDIDESVLIEGVGAGSTTGQKIRITMFGFSQEFDDVTGILIADMADGDDLVEIDEAVTVPIEVHLGVGSDSLNNRGGAPVIAYGDADGDFLMGGSSADQLFGGPGDDVIQGGLAADVVDGGDDSDLLIWNVGDGSDTTIDGQDGDDTLNVLGTDGSDDFMVGPAVSGTGFFLESGGIVIVLDGIENLNIDGGAGGDTFAISDLGSSLLGLVTLQLGGDGDADNVHIDGSGSADTFDISSIVVTLSSVDGSGDPVTEEVNGLQIVKDMGATVGVFEAAAAGGDLVELNTNDGDDIVHVRSVLAGAATAVNGGLDSDTFYIGADGSLNGIAAPLTINGNEPATGSDILNVDDSADTLGASGAMTATTITGLGLGAGIVYSGIEHLNIDLGSGPDTFTIDSTAAGTETALNTNGGNDTVHVRSIADLTTIHGGAGADTVHVGSLAPATGGVVDGIGALLSVHGDDAAVGNDTLNLDETGDAGANTGALTSSMITGLGMTGSISYATIEKVNVHLGGGSDTFNIQSVSVMTTVETGAGAADNTVHVGSLAPSVGGDLNSIAGQLIVNGQSSGVDSLNLDDTGDGAPDSGTLTSSAISGLGLGAGMDYSAIDALNISLGAGGNTFNVQSTSALTTINTGAGSANTVNVGSLAPAAGGNLNGVAGKLIVNGQSTVSETLNIDETGDTGANTGTLTSARLTGLGMAANDPARGIEYSGVDTLNLNLSNQADTLTIAGTSVDSVTTVNANGGADIINIQTVGGATLLNAGPGSDTINVGSNAAGSGADPDNNSGGTLDSILASLTINGDEPDSGSDVLTVDDSGDATDNTGGLTSTTITGFGLSSAGLTYTGIEHLVISLGGGADSVTVYSTHGAATATSLEETTINTGSGADIIDINDVTDLLSVNGEAHADTININGTGVGSVVTVHGGADNDVVNVQATGGEVDIFGDAGDDTINVGSAAPSHPALPTSLVGNGDAINGLVSVDGGEGGADYLNVDDSNPANDAKSGTLNAATIRGLEMEEGIDYANLEVLAIWLGAGDNTFTIDGTHPGETTVNMADGADTVDIHDVNGALTVNGAAGEDTFNVMGSSAGSVAVLAGAGDDDAFNIRAMDGLVYVSGAGGSDVVTVAGPLHTLLEIQGPLVIEAGGDVGTIDTLAIDNGAAVGAFGGSLAYRTMDDVSQPFANPGLALTGFGMGGDLATSDPEAIYYGGGVTYNGFEIVELTMGSGNEMLEIADTGDADEKMMVADDPAAITIIHAGAGADVVTVTKRGNGPLVLYGDAGDDTIDASAVAAKSDPFVGAVIDGGTGDDNVTGTQGDDHLAGGAGMDTINGEAGADHIYGDSSFSIDAALFARDQMQRFDTETELGLINAMFSVPVDQDGAADSINGGAGSDIIFGDHGVIGQVDGVRRIESAGSVVLAQTANIGAGAGDVIHGDGQNDVIFGGAAGDTIYGDTGSDLIFGDFGAVTGNVDAARIGEPDGAGVDNATAAFLYTSDTSSAADAAAGNDTIYGGSLAVLDTDTGKNILLGQQGADTIYGGGGDDDIYGGHNVADGSDGADFIDGAAGNDVILGDNGLIERTDSATDPRFTVLTGQRIYDGSGNALVADGNPIGDNPAGVEARRVVLFDHDNSPTANAGNYGDDVIAGGADDDVIFGQLGNDRIHGDGRLVDGSLMSLVATITGSDSGGDDYIEGNGGEDTIFGGLGQDDIVGGSSDFYGLGSAVLRPDGADVIYGGNGDLTVRNNYGDGVVDSTGALLPENARHGRDSDAIVGDNGNILRLVGTGGVDGGASLAFAYDNYAGEKIIVRAIVLLDYTPGGPDYSSAALADIGGGDTIRGESGDDFIYGQKGSDSIFGDAQDDDIVGGYGNDWISGGTGDDGVIGDDGRIFTSRNGVAETLYGIAVTTESHISVPGNAQEADINVTGQLKKSADLTPFSQDPNWVSAGDEFGGVSPHTSDDIIYGGLGNDWLHGGSGDDAISGAEALAGFYAAPVNAGNVLGYNAATGLFAAYDPNAPMKQIAGFLLNFDKDEGPAAGANTQTDGDDRIFGDLGNDWLVGGTGRDHLYGGFGNDLLNADDDQTTHGGLNDQPDSKSSYEDLAFGGGGFDILIANTAGDRLIDWLGAFNSYFVPFSNQGMPTSSREVSPQLRKFLIDLSLSDGADATRAADTGGDPYWNGEPFGELGLTNPSI
ncbi:MAG TPA: LEPR-XLL domain-containing protein, partial [Terriglobia bacterium]|nr:LEPR-XLL domain-containing protein [Terriglobia bacterium]